MIFKLLLLMVLTLISCKSGQNDNQYYNTAVVILDNQKQIMKKLDNIDKQNKEILESFYVEDPDDRGVIAGRSIDSIGIVEFEYKGKKFGRFSMEGAGRGFIMPLDNY